MSDTKQEPDTLAPKTVVLIFLGVVSFSLIVGAVPWMFFGLNSKAGIWGDSFGFVNSILSGLAFAAVVVTLWLQKTELRLQREELEATREQLKKSAEAQEKSQLALNEQVDSMFIAAYLNALNSVVQGPDLNLRPEGANALNKIESIIVGLEGRVEQITNHPLPNISIEEWAANLLGNLSTRIRDELEKYKDEDDTTERHMVGVISKTYQEFEIMLKSISDPEERESLKEVRNKFRGLSEYKIPPAGVTRYAKEQKLFFEHIRGLYCDLDNCAYQFRVLHEESQK